MKRVTLNADIGERGVGHSGDLALMEHVDMVNVACGGHAGDAASIGLFRRLAEKHGLEIAAHLSYPDPAHFGRLTMQIPFEQLRESLDCQLDRMAGAGRVKFHGALYNDAWAGPALARRLAAWLAMRGIGEVVAPHDSELAVACRAAGVRILAEAFAERRYVVAPATGRLSLASRSVPGGCVTDCRAALEQVRRIVEDGEVDAFVEDGGETPISRAAAITADTICIHSDSPIALELARAAARMLRKRDPASRGGGT